MERIRLAGFFLCIKFGGMGDNVLNQGSFSCGENLAINPHSVANILPKLSEYYELELFSWLERVHFYPYGAIFRLRIFGQISLPSARFGLFAIPSCEGDLPTHLLSRPLTSMRSLAGSMVRVVKRLSR